MIKLFSAVATAVSLFAPPAFAAQPLYAISPSDPDFAYYKRASLVDSAYVSDRLIDWFLDFDSSDYLKAVDESTPIRGRIVLFNDGPEMNPHNLVLVINNVLYFVNTELNQVDPNIRIRRNWRRGGGIYLVVEGLRVGARPRENRKVRIHLKVANLAGKALPQLGYLEDWIR